MIEKIVLGYGAALDEGAFAKLHGVVVLWNHEKY